MNDKQIHAIFNAWTMYKKFPCWADVRCKACGTPLKYYYAEDCLYLIKCDYCEVVTMIKASNPIHAAELVGEAVE